MELKERLKSHSHPHPIRLCKKEIAMKLNAKACLLACGIIWGLGIFILTWWIIAFDGATGERTLSGMCYRGYTISPIGSVIGMAWGRG